MTNADAIANQPIASEQLVDELIEESPSSHIDVIQTVIASLEQEQALLVVQLSDSDLYKNDSAKLTAIQTRMTELETLLTKRFERWEALEARNK